MISVLYLLYSFCYEYQDINYILNNESNIIGFSIHRISY